MRIIKVLCILLSIYSSNVFARFNCSGTIEEYAHEVVQHALSGAYLPQKISCLEELDLKYMNSYWSPNNENTITNIIYVDSYQILSVVAINKDVGRYRVSVLIKSNNKTYKENIGIILMDDQKFGCIGVLGRLTSDYIFKKCQ